MMEGLPCFQMILVQISASVSGVTVVCMAIFETGRYMIL